jgi:hypothetical protein
MRLDARHILPRARVQEVFGFEGLMISSTDKSNNFLFKHENL